MKLTFKNKNREHLFIFCISVYGLQEILSSTVHRTDGEPCISSLSLCLPDLPSLCSPGQREGPHHSEPVVKSTKRCCHLNTSNISGYGKPWEGVVAVISHGSFTPHLSETMFFLFLFVVLVRFAAIDLFKSSFSKSQELGTGVPLWASWNSRERDPGTGVKVGEDPLWREGYYFPGFMSQAPGLSDFMTSRMVCLCPAV